VAIALGYQGPDAFAGQLWVFRPGPGMSDGPVARIGDPDSASAHQGAIGWPVAAGGAVLAFKPGDRLGAWTIRQGGEFVEKWSARASAGKALAVTGGAKPLVLVADSGARRLAALALDTGKPVWSRAANATGMGASAGSVVFVPCQEKRPVKPGTRGRTDILDGVLLAVDAATGKTLWSVQKPDVTYNQPVIAAGRLFVSDTDGILTCYAPAR
jgi:outer membrane protein assembly factor BamB